MLSYLESARIDANYRYFYGDLFRLMLNAGRAVSEVVEEEFGKGQRICVVCGSGNNGGDGIVAASELIKSNSVSVIALRGRESLSTDMLKRAVETYNGPIEGPEMLDQCIANCTIVIDAILGVGAHGTPREPYASAIRKINTSGKAVVSIDVPSGLGSEIAVRPHITVTFTDVKEGMTGENSGKIVVRDIGIPRDAVYRAGPGDMLFYPYPEPGSHKGMNGTLSVFGGWSYYGSAVIAARAALAAGCDLVKVYTTRENAPLIASHSFEYMVSSIGDSVPEEAFRSRCILLGPGLGRDFDRRIVSQIIMRAQRIVLDADPLRLLPHLGDLSGKEVVVTPHASEFRDMSGMDPVPENAMEFAKSHGVVVVLKGEEDIITDGNSLYRCTGGNPRMTMGGTGDMLAGLISALMSKGMPALRASLLGTFINKSAADMCMERKGLWYSVSDMIGAVPEVFLRYSDGAKINSFRAH